MRTNWMMPTLVALGMGGAYVGRRLDPVNEWVENPTASLQPLVGRHRVTVERWSLYAGAAPEAKSALWYVVWNTREQRRLSTGAWLQGEAPSAASVIAAEARRHRVAPEALQVYTVNLDPRERLPKGFTGRVEFTHRDTSRSITLMGGRVVRDEQTQAAIPH